LVLAARTPLVVVVELAIVAAAAVAAVVVLLPTALEAVRPLLLRDRTEDGRRR
jgi:hypothetical protein